MGDSDPAGLSRVADPPLEQDERRPVSNHEFLPLAPGELDDVDTMGDRNRGPARGVIIALVPALLVWAGLITLFAKLL